MKKFILSTIAVLGAVLGANAQNSIFNNPDNHGYFGARIAAEVTCPGNITMGNMSLDALSNGGGIEFGAIYNAPLVANLYLEPGLKFFYNSILANDDTKDMMEVDSFSLRIFGMRVPVMVGYHFDFTENWKLYLFTGPELEIGLSGKAHAKEDRVSVSESIYGDDGMNRVDVKWGIGAGVSYQSLYFGLSGGIGMCNMSGDSNVKFHENRFSITLGYNF